MNQIKYSHQDKVFELYQFYLSKYFLFNKLFKNNKSVPSENYFFLSKFFCHIFIKRYQILFLIKKILKLYQPETVKYCCLELNFFTSYKLDIFEIIPPKLNFWKKFTRDFQSIHISTLKPHDPTRSIVQLLPFNFLQKCLEALTAQFELIIFDH